MHLHPVAAPAAMQAHQNASDASNNANDAIWSHKVISHAQGLVSASPAWNFHRPDHRGVHMLRASFGHSCNAVNFWREDLYEAHDAFVVVERLQDIVQEAASTSFLGASDAALLPAAMWNVHVKIRSGDAPLHSVAVPEHLLGSTVAYFLQYDERRPADFTREELELQQQCARASAAFYEQMVLFHAAFARREAEEEAAHAAAVAARHAAKQAARQIKLKQQQSQSQAHASALCITLPTLPMCTSLGLSEPLGGEGMLDEDSSSDSGSEISASF